MIFLSDVLVASLFVDATSRSAGGTSWAGRTLDKPRRWRYWFDMTPERRQHLMDQAAAELRARWGEVQPEALQALTDDLRIGVVENGSLSAEQIVTEVTHRPHGRGLFGVSQTANYRTLSAEQAADKQRDLDLDR